MELLTKEGMIIFNEIMNKAVKTNIKYDDYSEIMILVNSCKIFDLSKVEKIKISKSNYEDIQKHVFYDKGGKILKLYEDYKIKTYYYIDHSKTDFINKLILRFLINLDFDKKIFDDCLPILLPSMKTKKGNKIYDSNDLIWCLLFMKNFNYTYDFSNLIKPEFILLRNYIRLLQKYKIESDNITYIELFNKSFNKNGKTIKNLNDVTNKNGLVFYSHKPIKKYNYLCRTLLKCRDLIFNPDESIHSETKFYFIELKISEIDYDVEYYYEIKGDFKKNQIIDLKYCDINLSKPVKPADENKKYVCIKQCDVYQKEPIFIIDDIENNIIKLF